MVCGVYSVPHDLNRPAHAEVVKVVKCQVIPSSMPCRLHCLSVTQTNKIMIHIFAMQIDGISVDISANALGGLFTLCLLEKVLKDKCLDVNEGRDVHECFHVCKYTCCQALQIAKMRTCRCVFGRFRVYQLFEGLRVHLVFFETFAYASVFFEGFSVTSVF